MGQVIRFSDHKVYNSHARSSAQDSLIPVELALGIEDEKVCLSTIAQYGQCPVYPRLLSDGSGAILYLVTVSDAIILNKIMLDSDQLDDQQLSICIDLIQMLENVNDSLLEGAWGSIEESQNLYR